jgi:hypothetical protein
MLTEQGKWLDGEAMFFEQTCETQHLGIPIRHSGLRYLQIFTMELSFRQD